ncbi:MAG: hypothetical protein IJ521_06430 [Schwartzia sp.]|nr:hypothetical protein [Schwartzia sp. (in: firmicutes)]
MEREHAPIYENTVCPICGRFMWSAVNCQKARAAVHGEHCFQCSYYERWLGHCTYLFRAKRKASGVTSAGRKRGQAPAPI